MNNHAVRTWWKASARHLKKGSRIRNLGAGHSWQVRKRARPGWAANPATGEAIKIKASKKIAFSRRQKISRNWVIVGLAVGLHRAPLLRGPLRFDQLSQGCRN